MTTKLNTRETYQPWCIAVETGQGVHLYLYDSRREAVAAIDDHDEECNREVMRTSKALERYPDAIM